jgi:hypothetical protein
MRSDTMSKFKELICTNETVGFEGEVEKVKIRRFIQSMEYHESIISKIVWLTKEVQRKCIETGVFKIEEVIMEESYQQTEGRKSLESEDSTETVDKEKEKLEEIWDMINEERLKWLIKKSEVKVFLKWGYEMDELKNNDLVTLYRNLKGRIENEVEIKQKLNEYVERKRKETKFE